MAEHIGRTSGPQTAWLVVALVASAAAGAVILIGYVASATVELFDCVNLMSDAPSPPAHEEGGQDSSVYAAAVVSVAAWLGAWKLTVATTLRRWPLLMVPVFAILDLTGLTALWHLAPGIWGPEHCVPD